MTASTSSAALSVPVADDRDHIQGQPTAAVTLVEYGDFECPYCGMAYPVVKRIQREMGDRLRFVFRQFPISTSHPHAEAAAQAAEAAGAQGRFWELHDRLYEHQDQLADDELRAHAEAVGLDTDRFDRELAAGRYEERVREDFMGGVRSGVNGTPTFFINGARHDGPFDHDALLDSLQRASHARGDGS